MRVKFLIIFILSIWVMSFGLVLAQELPSPANIDKTFIETSGLGTKASLGAVVASVIRIFLSFLGVIFVVLIIYAGYMWMTAAGNEEQISRSKRIIISAFIGITIVMAAYAITFFVIDQILEATQGGTGLPQ